MWKYCTQYANKFGKLNSSHRTRKGQFSFWSQRKAKPKNAQTTTQLHSSHMLAKWCSKLPKLGFNRTCTKNSQRFKLDLEKAEEPEIKFPTVIGLLKKQESSRKTSAKSLQLCPTLCNPMDGSPPGFPIPGILQARTLEWVAISFSNAWKWKVKVKSLSHVRLFATTWTVA